MERKIYFTCGLKKDLNPLHTRIRARIQAYKKNTEQKKRIVYVIGCTDWEALYFRESKLSFKSRSNEQQIYEELLRLNELNC